MLTRDAVLAQASALGFDLCGISRGARHPRLARLADWIAAGRAGDMRYLARSLDERLDPERVLPTVRSVVSVACVYSTDEPGPTDAVGPEHVAIARYARGDDYHEVIGARLRRFVAWMADQAGAGFEAFSCVDCGPVQERVFAEQAGLGWIGKNTCLINPQVGSWILLGEVLTNAELVPDAPAVDHCGSCTRCLDACPTGAIIEPYVLDARRCLSYLTIETRHPVDPALRPAIRDRVFGCDICQEVCPWNGRAATNGEAAWQPREGLAAPRLMDLCAWTDEAWRVYLRGSAMRRAGLRRLRRSLAYAAAHLPTPDRDRALDALQAHPSSRAEDVAEAIEWARRGGRPDGGRGTQGC
jgi:epoxyqueuosine reductase